MSQFDRTSRDAHIARLQDEIREKVDILYSLLDITDRDVDNTVENLRDIATPDAFSTEDTSCRLAVIAQVIACIETDTRA